MTDMYDFFCSSRRRHTCCALVAGVQTCAIPIFAGANVRSVPIGPGFDFFAGLDRAYRHSVPAPIALIVSFPANPTAMTVDLAFYEAIIDFAKKRNNWVISDLAYSEIYFDGYPPPSILQEIGRAHV